MNTRKPDLETGRSSPKALEGVTPYSGITRFYFRHLLKQIVKVGRLDRTGITVLDFGCGRGELKRLAGSHIIGYDVIPELSEVDDWRNIDFDVLVANEVFYSFNEHDLDHLLQELKARNRTLELVVGISRQGLLNNLGKHLFGRPNAHAASKIGPGQEIEILSRHCTINRRKNVLNLAYVYAMQFRP